MPGNRPRNGSAAMVRNNMMEEEEEEIISPLKPVG